MSIKRAPMLIAISLAIVVSFEIMNFTNFCYRDMRYYTDDHFIAIAIKANLDQFDKNGERNKYYANANDVISQNPDCCHIYYTDSSMNVTFQSRLIGLNRLVVVVYYKISDAYQKYKYYSSTVAMNSCGDILQKFGTPEETGPIVNPRR